MFKRLISCLILLICGCSSHFSPSIIAHTKSGFVDTITIKFNYIYNSIYDADDLDVMIYRIQTLMQDIVQIREQMQVSETRDRESHFDLYESELHKISGMFDSAKINFLESEFVLSNQVEADAMILQLQTLLRDLENIKETMVQDEVLK